jgi:cell wall-associated NlpC family hydrolase/LysM repeat protein
MTYKVKQGENDWTISHNLHLKVAQLRAMNPGVDWNRLRPGVVLKISASNGFAQSHSAPVAKATPTVLPTSTQAGYSLVKAQASDNDWTLGRRFHVSPKTIRLLNPKVDWRRVRPGLAIRIPAKTTPVVAKTNSNLPPLLTKWAPALEVTPNAVAVKAPTPKAKPALPAILVYSAGSDDNDWIIAHKFGVTPPFVRAANPKVDWNRLRPGTKIRIPSTINGHPIAKATGIHTHYAVLMGNHVNVRAGARTDAPSVLKVDGGTPAVVVDRISNWYKLEFPHGTKGWVRGDFLVASANRPRQLSAYEKEDRSVILAREAREEEEESEARAAREERIARRERDEERAHWLRTRHHGTSHHQSDDEDDSRVARNGNSDNGILSTAERMLGTRYRWGAASRSATDCSGFTSQVFARNGFRLPRTAREQSEVGRRVSRDGLKPGDLVFFRTRGSGVSHVGIYEGNNSFIHASSAKGHVTISKLDGYYARRFAGARRVAH